MTNIFSSTNVDLYHLLELEQCESNQIIIKKNFSNLIKLFHSDRGGDSKFHQQLVEAYRILSDPIRKYIYDNFGLVGVYSLKEVDEDIIIFETILSSPYSTKEDLEIVKNQIKKKISKKIQKIFFNSIDADFMSADISANYTTGLIDYLYLSYLLDNRNIYLGKKFVNTRFAMNNNFSLFKSKDNQKELSLNVNYSVDKSNQTSQHSYSFNFNNKLNLPFGLKLFENNYLDTDYEITLHNDSENVDIAFKKTLTIHNFFYQSPLSFTISPSYSLLGNYLEGLELQLQHNASPSRSIRTKLDILGKSLDSVLTWKPKNTNRKYIGFLNLGSNFLIGLYIHQVISNNQAKSHSIMLRNNSIILNNESILIWKSFIFKLTSGMQFVKKKENHISFSSSITLQLQFKSLKINIPIVTATKSNVFNHCLIFFSTVLINIGVSIYKKLRKVLIKTPNYIKIYDKINYERQNRFNQENLNYSIEVNKKENGQLLILHAYFGEISKIVQILKHIEIFGFFSNMDNTIFDIRIPVSLKIVESKMEIPKDISDIEGIYLPDFFNKDSLGYLIIYSYQYRVHTVLNQNNKKEIFLP